MNERGDIAANLVWAVGVVIGLTLALRLMFDIDLLVYIGDAADWLERKF